MIASESDPREERARYAELQERLPDLFRRVFSDDRAPRTVVVVPGLSLDTDVLAKVSGGLHYEERQLSMLMLLRLPHTRVVFVTSLPLERVVVDYYLHLLSGIPASHARRRLILLSANDPSPVTLTRKILDRPRLLERIRSAIGDPRDAHLSCFNATELERTLALRLGIPLYACDPELIGLGSKSGSRRVFREAGILQADGFEGLRDEQDVVDALVSLRERDPGLARAAIKLEEGFSGEGNAIFSFKRAPTGAKLGEWIRRRLRDSLVFGTDTDDWGSFGAKLAEMGGIVESWIEGAQKCSPSVQMRITPVGGLELISTHEQILGGRSGQVFLGSTFPAAAAYARDLHEVGERVGEVLRRNGVMGRFGVDFVSVPEGERWRHYAIEINLRKGGTTHTYQMLQFLTAGRYEAETGLFRLPTDQVRFYAATDTFQKDVLRRLTPEDLIDIAVEDRLHYDETRQQGVVFHLLGAISCYGKVGLVAIADTPRSALELFERTTRTLVERAEEDFVNGG
jgi:PGM1 C-terminal domain